MCTSCLTVSNSGSVLVLSENREWNDEEENQGDQSKSQGTWGDIQRYSGRTCQHVLGVGWRLAALRWCTPLGTSWVWQVHSGSVLVLAPCVPAQVHALFEGNWLWWKSCQASSGTHSCRAGLGEFPVDPVAVWRLFRSWSYSSAFLCLLA